MDKGLPFAQKCERNFGGNPLAGRAEITFHKKKRPEGHFLEYKNLFGVPDSVIIGLDEVDTDG